MHDPRKGVLSVTKAFPMRALQFPL